MKLRYALLVCLATAGLRAADSSYKLESLPDPDSSLLIEVGGLNFAADGTLYIATRRGEVWSLKDGHYHLFAAGLAECLGVLPTDPGVVTVTQRGEITRLTDSDHDGQADLYECVTESFGYTGNYHEFNFGLVRDSAGNLYGALNLAHTGHDPWGSTFMGADVPNRGTAYQITPDGGYHTFAYGLRSPNGIALSPAGDLFCVDSQGEYVATNCLYHLLEGHFYNHPASLSFKPGFTGSPVKTTIQQLAKMRTPPVAWIPYARQGHSVTEPRFDTTAGKFGPFAGQIFCGDTTEPILTRIDLEKIAGEFQGAVFPFLRDPSLEGANRFAFAPDGSLYIGLTNRGWAGGSYGLKRLTFTGTPPADIQSMHLTTNGFQLTFTVPVDPAAASKPDTYQLLHYHYEYHKNYGSDELDKTPVKITKVELSGDHKSAHLILPELLPGKVYELHLKPLKTESGQPLRNTTAWYTLNRLKAD